MLFNDELLFLSKTLKGIGPLIRSGDSDQGPLEVVLSLKFSENIWIETKIEEKLKSKILDLRPDARVVEQNPEVGIFDLLLMTDLSKFPGSAGSRFLVKDGPVTPANSQLFDACISGENLLKLLQSHLWKDLPNYRWKNHFDPDLQKQKKKALFLDRDGVINVDKNYLSDPNDLELVPGIRDLILAANQNGFEICVVTNQSAIGRGYMDFERYLEIEARIEELLEFDDSFQISTLAAPFFSSSENAFGRLLPHWRKPRPGMFQIHALNLGLDLSQGIMIGDSATDLLAAAEAGLKKIYLILNEEKPLEWQKWQEALKENRHWENVDAKKIHHFSEVKLT